MDYDIEYAEGVTTYTMTAPFPLSYEAEGEMSVFDFTMISPSSVGTLGGKGLQRRYAGFSPISRVLKPDKVSGKFPLTPKRERYDFRAP